MDMEVPVLMGMVALVTKVPMIAMKDLVQHLNTSVREHPIQNAIRLHAPYHLNFVKIEKMKCEKLTERVPVPKEKQVCHDEKKKVCELEQRSQPKQVKKYVYTKQCRPVPKTVCDNADQMSLVPSCVPSSRKECSYYPEERCENVPKQHCYQIEKKIANHLVDTIVMKPVAIDYLLLHVYFQVDE